MPYSNIVFVKLFLSLFEEDDRFLYQLNESQQLLYVKMLYMAGTTNNHITKNVNFICNKLNYHHESNSFLADMERIKSVFPNGFIEEEGFYKFKNFNRLHNYIGKYKGIPKENPKSEKGVARIREEKRRIREEIPPSLETVSNYCKERKNGINPEAFINHYQAKGWLIGKTKMKDWQACVRTWEKPKVEPIKRKLPI